MRAVVRIVTVAFVVVAVCPAALSAQAKDPRIGVWKLNVAKSVFPGGNRPQSVVRTYEDRGGGVVLYGQEVVTAQGNRTVLFTTYRLDGLDYPQATVGAKGVSMISQRLLDAYTVEAVVKLDGRVTGGMTQTVSQDGRTLTIKNKNGAIQVFEK